jgi:hypothetical protein
VETVAIIEITFTAVSGYLAARAAAWNGGNAIPIARFQQSRADRFLTAPVRSERHRSAFGETFGNGGRHEFRR